MLSIAQEIIHSQSIEHLLNFVTGSSLHTTPHKFVCVRSKFFQPPLAKKSPQQQQQQKMGLEVRYRTIIYDWCRSAFSWTGWRSLFCARQKLKKTRKARCVCAQT
jgi:hypothetical protein